MSTERDRELDRLSEIHDDLRARRKVWLRKVFHSEIPGDFTQVRTMEQWIQKLYSGALAPVGK